jgi:hypothetical protein
MNRTDQPKDPRRRLLVEALTLGALGLGMPSTAAAQESGDAPQKMPPDRSIFRLVGTVTVNGRAATLQTSIRAGDTVQTGPASEVVFVVGAHSMLLRADSTLTVNGETTASGLVVQALRMLSGKLLAVSRNAPTRVITTTATIGIRGTGYYTEADPDQTYFCTCYGATDIEALNDPASRESVTSKQHDRPLYILRAAEIGRYIREAPIINHTDEELMLVEALVGRAPPFMKPYVQPSPPAPQKY